MITYKFVYSNGNILLISSIAAYVPFVGLGAYGVTKMATLALNKELARSLAQRNIRVNAIATGLFNDDTNRCSGGDDGDIGSMIPLGRFGRADDCVGVAAFLVSDEARYITGETITVAGGVHVRF
jgi:3-oxoacyl-[acyl-carrier protein] reductase